MDTSLEYGLRKSFVLAFEKLDILLAFFYCLPVFFLGYVPGPTECSHGPCRQQDPKLN